MFGSLLYQDIVDEAKREDRQQIVLDILKHRFGPEAKDVEAQLRAIGFDRLMELIRFAEQCRSLASFRKRLLDL